MGDECTLLISRVADLATWAHQYYRTIATVQATEVCIDGSYLELE